MAITPAEATVISAEELAAVFKREKQIDDYLRSRYNGSNAVNIDIPAEGRIVCQELKRRYRMAGWRIEEQEANRLWIFSSTNPNAVE